jgi:hypothetical protein
MEFHRRQVAQVFLDAVIAMTHSLDASTEAAVLSWPHTVHKGLSLAVHITSTT